MEAEKEKIKIGMIRPISEIDKLPPKHWETIQKTVKESLKFSKKYSFELEPIFESEETTLIQSTIITNICNLGLIICDISCLNPNVMFELGLRLGIDKAVVIIKDKETVCPFDIASIKYIEYERTQKRNIKLKFKKDLVNSVEKTIEASKIEGYSPFLKHYDKKSTNRNHSHTNYKLNLSGTANIQHKIEKNELKNKIENRVNKLDSAEKAVLREFYIRGRNTIKMPMNDSAVSGLLEVDIIRKVSDREEEVYGVGKMCDCAINIKLNKRLLNITENINELISKRPKWVLAHIKILRSNRIETDMLFFSEDILKVIGTSPINTISDEKHFFKEKTGKPGLEWYMF